MLHQETVIESCRYGHAKRDKCQKYLQKHQAYSSTMNISKFTCLSIWDTDQNKKGLHQILIAYFCPFAFFRGMLITYCTALSPAQIRYY